MTESERAALDEVHELFQKALESAEKNNEHRRRSIQRICNYLAVEYKLPLDVVKALVTGSQTEAVERPIIQRYLPGPIFLMLEMNRQVAARNIWDNLADALTIPHELMERVRKEAAKLVAPMVSDMLRESREDVEAFMSLRGKSHDA